MVNEPERIIKPHGMYGKLRSFQAAEIIYDATVTFCDRFIEENSRIRGLMIQAARSGVLNIAEGNMASATSKETELKFTTIARASLEELLLDYEDFLRQQGMRPWPKKSPEVLAVLRKYRAYASALSDGSKRYDRSDLYSIRTATAEEAANTIVCLINHASSLLGRQIRKLEDSFVSEGGFTERLHHVRGKFRRRHR